jgi:hypothetical protein
MSFGFLDYSHEIHKAVRHAYAKNVVMLAAASNDGCASTQPIAYPAEEPGKVFAVNSATHKGYRSEFNPPSAVNADNFMFLGENVLSTWSRDATEQREVEEKDGPWRRMTGTSVATPIAAAIAATLLHFGRKNKTAIGEENDHYKQLENYDGIRQMFSYMTLDKNRYRAPDDFEYVDPWKLLDFGNGSTLDMIAGQISTVLRRRWRG